MTSLADAIEKIRNIQVESMKPLAIVLAGHNGAGKSTMWYKHLANTIQIPLVNADRMMMSILPPTEGGRLPTWAAALRDTDTSWMTVAQKGVQAFVAQAMANSVPFAMETVFSHWREVAPGKVESKIDLIRQMQEAGYFVILIFVGLSDCQLSLARVLTRVASGGHAVGEAKLVERFPRTQKAIANAVQVANAAILVDNSRTEEEAFTVCKIQAGAQEIYDVRKQSDDIPRAILDWLDIISPREGAVA